MSDIPSEARMKAAALAVKVAEGERKVAEVSARAATPPYIELFELENINRNVADPQLLFRFTPNTNGNNVVAFGGEDYFPIACSATGFEQRSGGTLPRPTFKIGVVGNAYAPYVFYNADLVGWSFKRIRTFGIYLDGEPMADSLAHLPIDYYRIERKYSQNPEYIEWECTSMLSHEGKQLPGRQIIRDFCTHPYRTWDADTGTFDYGGTTCPYRAARIYNTDDNVVATGDLDDCGRTLKSCRLRFPGEVALPTRAFPGIRE